MSRRRFLAALGVGAIRPRHAIAQAARSVARVGWIGWAGPALGQTPVVPLEGLRQGLKEHGWLEGRNLVLATRVGGVSQARQLAAELVAEKVDVIVTQGPMVFGARHASDTTPVLFAINGDPVEAGLVASLARPGVSITGITALTLALAGKRLELLREARPGLSRVAVIANAGHPGLQSELHETRSAAARLGVAMLFVPVASAQDFDAAFSTIAGDGASALLAFPDTLINAQARNIANFAARRRIPSISGWAEFAQAGNLLSYGPNLRDYYRHLAGYANKLLRGAHPIDLPVEQPTRFELVVNLRAAKALGITLPRSLLLRADEVIQ